MSIITPRVFGDMWGIKMKWTGIRKPEGVSLCMITKNEEVNPAGGIEAFLGHHLPMVDEIVLVDTGSADRTVEIAKSFDKVRAFQYKWDGSFSRARNFSLEQANYDHILVLDADEKLMMPNSQPIKPFFYTKKGDIFGYEFVFIDISQDGTLMRRTNHTDPDGYNHRVRYFMNLSCLRFRGRVHEELVDTSDMGIMPFIQGHLEAGLVVQHYLPPKDVLKKKIEFYESLREKAA